MVGEETLSDLSARVGADARRCVSDLSDDARQRTRAEPMELMRQAVTHVRGHAGKQKTTTSMLFADETFASAARTSL
jgi:hypothetical protein